MLKTVGFPSTRTGDQTIVNGNEVIATAGKGVNFTANTPAAGMTSQLLNWYEEGTWTPSVGGNATYWQQIATYTRVGRLVTVFFALEIRVLGTGSPSTISGLPFTSGAASAGIISSFQFIAVNQSALTIALAASASSITLLGTPTPAATATTANVLQDGSYVVGTLTYQVA